MASLMSIRWHTPDGEGDMKPGEWLELGLIEYEEFEPFKAWLLEIKNPEWTLEYRLHGHNKTLLDMWRDKERLEVS